MIQKPSLLAYFLVGKGTSGKVLKGEKNFTGSSFGREWPCRQKNSLVPTRFLK